MKRALRKTLIHVLLPLVIGFFIYFFFRPDFGFVQVFGRTEPLTDPGSLGAIGQTFIFSGPDACWAYSLSAALFIWGIWAQISRKYYPWLIFLLVITSELIQLFLPSKFTFSWSDLIAAVLGFVLSYLIIYRYEKN